MQARPLEPAKKQRADFLSAVLDEINDFNAEEEVNGPGGNAEEEGFDEFVDAPVAEPQQEVRTAAVDIFSGESFPPAAAGRDTPVQQPPQPASMDLFNIKPSESFAP